MTAHTALVPPTSPPLPADWARIEQTEAGVRVDAVVLPDDAAQARALRRQGTFNPLAYVIARSGVGIRGADRYCDTSDREELALALEAARVVAGRVRALASARDARERDALLALGYLHTRDTELSPCVNADASDFFDYPQLAFLPQPRQTLERLAAARLLTRRFHERTHVCRDCGSARVHAREVCAQCRSAHVSDKQVIHHYRCGTQRPKADFLQGTTLVCPKCDRELRHFGVDYDAPGVIVQCDACGEVATEPAVELLCGDCGGRTGADTADHVDWHAYTLTEAGRVACVTGRMPAERLQDRLMAFDTWRSPESFAVVTDYCVKLGERYARHFVVMALRIADDQALYDKLGPQALHKYYDLVVDLLAQLLRKTDSVSMIDDEILLCLPETDPASFAAIEARIRGQMSQVLGIGEYIEARLLDAEQIAAFLARMNADA
ncbi:TackOD1 domain-containing metal-binding protein [Pseudazoarcus pumilus]|uniref:Thaumarchaeal output domain-containing protein n=1 Tax=Pseudazoarcus pumilus TaxID=2067960 RepID=A0A2I6S6M6_9RHOO|nr:hypothetical protein [Pseudazoarcus pumilus]AUN94914.1 hypothetical protein C0099_08195 [Pseudazoarcus pumilus]